MNPLSIIVYGLGIITDVNIQKIDHKKTTVYAAQFRCGTPVASGVDIGIFDHKKKVIGFHSTVEGIYMCKTGERVTFSFEVKKE